jgi:hypothetical protein
MPENNQTTKPKRKTRKELVEAGERGLTFKNLDSMYRFCVAVAASKEFRDIETPEQALMRLQAGLELGLSPIWSITNIMVVNGRSSQQAVDASFDGLFQEDGFTVHRNVVGNVVEARCLD